MEIKGYSYQDPRAFRMLQIKMAKQGSRCIKKTTQEKILIMVYKSELGPITSSEQTNIASYRHSVLAKICDDFMLVADYLLYCKKNLAFVIRNRVWHQSIL